MSGRQFIYLNLWVKRFLKNAFNTTVLFYSWVQFYSSQYELFWSAWVRIKIVIEVIEPLTLIIIKHVSFSGESRFHVFFTRNKMSALAGNVLCNVYIL